MRSYVVVPGREPARRVRALWPRRGLPEPIPPLPGFDDIRDTHPETGRDLSGAARRGQNPISQILRIRPPPSPRHLALRPSPESHESHVGGESESPRDFSPPDRSRIFSEL